MGIPDNGGMVEYWELADGPQKRQTEVVTCKDKKHACEI